MSIRKRVYDILDPGHYQDLLSKTANYVIYTLIFLSVVAIVLESVPSISRRCSAGFAYFEILAVTVFSVEYLLRLWSCVESPKYASPLRGRLKHLLSPLAIIEWNCSEVHIQLTPPSPTGCGWDNAGLPPTIRL
ncbi:MAG: hypothetical protein HY343_12180 [Lentisphaerae bacterium]|nr:hypothetical protein [Lentisphaerota bacterium]